MPEFRFKIGDEVVFKQAQTEGLMAARVGRLQSPRVFIITERMWQECPGGVQLHYSFFARDEKETVLEQDLMLASEYDSGAAIDAYYAFMVNKIDRELDADEAREAKRRARKA
jgi:hypothetical protein